LKYSTISLDDEESDVPEPATVGTPETALLATFNQQAIQSALEVLPLHFREVILLCDVEEMSYQAIAEALAIPIGTVMSRLSRARRAMRAQLADEPGNPRPRSASR
jgi:RNA polymerase sigma-70 factor (ECF subfamily)